MTNVLKCAALVALTALLIVASLLVWDAKKLLDFEQPRITALVSELTLTTKIARKTSTDESAFLKAQQPAISAALRNVNKTLESAQQTLDTTSAAVSSVRPLLEQTQRTIAGLEPVEASINAAVSDPEIHATLVAAHKSADAASGMAEDGHRVTKYYADKLLAPKRWFQKLEQVAQHIKSFLPPLF